MLICIITTDSVCMH